MARIISITIDENGDQTVDLAGYAGKGCEAVAKAFAAAVGTSVDIKRKPEWNKIPVKKNTITR